MRSRRSACAKADLLGPQGPAAPDHDLRHASTSARRCGNSRCRRAARSGRRRPRSRQTPRRRAAGGRAARDSARRDGVRRPALPTCGRKVERHVAERRDAQRLRDELELRVPRDRVGHRAATGGCRRRSSAVAGGADLPQRQPDLQRAEAARVLRPVVDVVRRLLVEVVVRRVIGERGAQRFRIAHQRAAGFERRVEPLVRIDGDRVRAGSAPRRSSGASGTRRGEAAVRAIDVEPDAVLPAERAISGSGSTAPVLTDPAVPTTRNGTSPAARSASICRRSAATSIRWSASVGIQRIDAVPRPDRSAAF